MSAPPGPVSPAVMRDVLGHFVSGIVVITAAGPDGPLGFTCQSFSSLSLEPPLVSFAPARTSSTWPRIRAVGAFCVNVLAADHRELSTGFARSGVDKFAGVAWRPGPSGAPVLDGVSAWIDCELRDEFDGGDHTIVVAQVRDLGADPERLPLLYYRGRYAVTAGEGG
ncbi:flavin reductase family protein [Pseudonocardia hydrocarbonoxydans]|jgi:3-hydroxy-9,10-secoandrosta-1,3,5(10)-triene-9,17-dione monooxygenase reductase component|uniref:Monooxygenase n=1 Tax=Pseudonocardia hydrocarbonoxydans TaxID=76726 RepID=A0A4Y3WJG0_9PSEU|nr:flavin reductase family protein [Pseudonocardia hydrocarbonoxydans]GEC18391.1 monooxygenase [Pseudonocardia hydrocarbonoxydans]